MHFSSINGRYSSFSSMIVHSLWFLRQKSATVPLPPNISRTCPPTGHPARIGRLTSSCGNTAKCAFGYGFVFIFHKSDGLFQSSGCSSFYFDIKALMLKVVFSSQTSAGFLPTGLLILPDGFVLTSIMAES